MCLSGVTDDGSTTGNQAADQIRSCYGTKLLLPSSSSSGIFYKFKAAVLFPYQDLTLSKLIGGILAV